MSFVTLFHPVICSALLALAVDGAISGSLQMPGTPRRGTPSGSFYTLARAYQRAGLAADAKGERAEFSRLDRLQQEQRGGPNAVGGPAK